jgi:CheY-like chemotaxis protein/anti-sigma regulatory factor (Ser/Thr protein kinase)
MTTVLVVDDLATHRQLAAGLLSQQEGYAIDFAVSGQDALDLLARQRVDIVVTDLMMPEMDGLELIRAVRHDHPHLPVILMTAAGSEQIAVQALQEGAASYVPKSVLAERLAETVARVVQESRAERTHTQLSKRLNSLDLTFVLENDATLILALPGYVEPYLQGAGMTDRLVLLRTRIALGEALVNALYHGNLELGRQRRELSPEDFYRLEAERREQSPYRERRINVGITMSAERVEFTVRDDGPGFNPAKLPAAGDLSCLDSPRGRGVMLMRSFMDDVRYNRTGNVVTLTKGLASAAS